MRIQRSPFKPRAKSGYKIENKTTEEATVYIYDEISWFGINAEQFIKDLNDLKSKTVNIRINSPGGSVFDGTAVFNAIKQHKSKTCRLPNKSLFRPDEAANYFGYGVSTIYTWIQHGILKAEKYKGTYRISREAILTCRFRSQLDTLV